VAAAAIADDAVVACAQVDADAAGLQFRRLARLEAQLVQAGARLDQDGEGLGRDLEIEGAVITFVHVVEAAALIGQQAHKDVDAAGRAFGIGARVQAARQVQTLLQARDVDAALLHHIAAVGQVDGVHGDVGDAFLDLALAGQEGGAHAPGLVRQPQVQTGGLGLIDIEGGVGSDGADRDQGLNTLEGKDAGLVGDLKAGHAVLFSHGFSRLCSLSATTDA